MSKKKIVIGLIASLLILFLGVVLSFIIGLMKVSSNNKEINFTIELGRNTKEIINDLKDANLIKSKFITLIYLKMHPEILLQAGDYVLKENMTTPEILNLLTKGSFLKDGIKITFTEGERLINYLKKTQEIFKFSDEEINNLLNDDKYFKDLVEKYWFLEDVVLNENIYYDLEGYLFPETYEFFENATLKEIIEKMLDQTDLVLKKYEKEIKESKYSIHELLTMASIIEKEALSDQDRYKVSQVIYKRIDINMNLGMDVTSYYGVQKDLTEPIYKADLDDNNPYNTRLASFLGLPIGPICNPSESSIKAALNPAQTDYIWFFADINTGKVYFTNNYNEFQTFKQTYGG
ncbi:MAG: endolytic transglycosylase MltG [Firmicutes bacterium]|nr:endolytic transglycosylase MltG [Bacillota bacterium]